MSVFGRIKSALFWSKALDLVSSGRYEESLEMLDKAAAYLPEGAEQLLLRGQILGGLTRFTESILAFEEALRRILSSDARLKMDKLYLASFAEWRIRDANLHLYRSMGGVGPDYSAVNLAAVSSHIKRKFPLREHPAWVE